MKKTPLYDTHVALSAKMVEFAGFEMPVVYTTITEEHQNVRLHAGLFDVSHMGQFMISGPEALNLVQMVSSNDASKLKINQAQYSCLPNDKGGIVDDLIVYRLEEQKFMLVVNAANAEKDYFWINSANTFDARLEDLSDHYALLALQGPKATRILQKLTSTDLDDIAFYHFTTGAVAGIDNVIISATGYTGSGGFELYISNTNARHLWDAIMEAGKADHILPIGLGARDTLRLEMGYCLYGNDINDNTSPIEAGLGWIVKTKKDSDFFSKDHFIAQRRDGITRKLVGFVLDDKRVPRQGYPIANTEEEEIGFVTSGTMSPSLDMPIGMGYVPVDVAKPGNDILIQVRKKFLRAKIVALPFYKNK